MNGNISHRPRPSTAGTAISPYTSHDHIQGNEPDPIFERFTEGIDHQPDGNRRPTLLDERVDQLRKHTSWDVACLIINKMIGSGIFTGPGVVLLNTRNKNIAIMLWILGLIYTLLSMLLYTEYSRRLPYNGGELVYMDDAAPRPRLLAYTLYTSYFVLIYTSTTNAMQFGSYAIRAANADPEDNQRILRFISVTVLTAISFLLFVSTRKSKWVNIATAATKVILLCGVILAGAAYIGESRSNGTLSNSAKGWDTTIPGDTNWSLAFVTVLFSFHGWENATLVAGEIISFRTLRNGFISAVAIVGTLYIAVTLVLCAAFEWNDDPADNNGIPQHYLALYLGHGSASAVTAAIIVCISAFGSALSVSFTCTRVKQSMGWSNILPWSSIWRRQGPIYPSYRWRTNAQNQNELTTWINERPMNRPGTPEGGIILHWIVSTFYVCVTAAFESVTEGISFSGNLLVYGHFFAEAAVALLYIPLWNFGYKPYNGTQFLPARHWHGIDGERQHRSFWIFGSTSRRSNVDDKPAGLPPRWMRPKRAPLFGTDTLLGFLVLAFSMTIIIAAPFTESERILLWVMLGVLGTGAIYWLLFIWPQTAMHVLKFFGFRLVGRTHGQDDSASALRACDWCIVGFEPHRHPFESYYAYNEINLSTWIATTINHYAEYADIVALCEKEFPSSTTTKYYEITTFDSGSHRVAAARRLDPKDIKRLEDEGKARHEQKKTEL